MKTGRRTVGTSAVPITLTSSVENGLRIYASPDNTADVYFGFADTVTADADDATDGFPIPPGLDEFIPQTHFRRPGSTLTVYLIAQTADNKVWFSVE